MLGDQVYADDSSPATHKRIEKRREHASVEGLPPELVGDFEEYCWLYHESWSPDVERWFFSVVPTAMIFDDHDMIDDWNISDSWVREIRQQPWWSEHVIGGLVSYWIYQHLGNMSPAEIRAEGMLAELGELDDGFEYLREWARSSEEFTPVPGGYRFSFARRLGDVALVVIDARNGRVLEPGNRSIVDDDEWAWIVNHCETDARHLLIGSSLPAFVPGGIHDLQRWNERVCDGAWGRLGIRLGERARRALDLEDWPAFGRSFDALVALLAALGSADRLSPPATISVLSGDIHFSYHSVLHFPSCHTRHQSRPPSGQLSDPQRVAAVRAQRDASRHVAGGRADRARATSGDRRSAPNGELVPRPRTGVRELRRTADVRRRVGNGLLGAGDRRR